MGSMSSSSLRLACRVATPEEVDRLPRRRHGVVGPPRRGGALEAAAQVAPGVGRQVDGVHVAAVRAVCKAARVRHRRQQGPRRYGRLALQVSSIQSFRGGHRRHTMNCTDLNQVPSHVTQL